jgi:hypothetical protein
VVTGVSAIALTGAGAGASTPPAATVPAYVTAGASRYLGLLALRPSTPGPLTLGQFAVMFDAAAGIHGSPALPYPSNVVGTGLRERDLALAVEDGMLPNQAPGTALTAGTAEAAVAGAVGVGTLQASTPATVDAALRGMGLALAGAPGGPLTPDQAATYLAGVFLGDPAAEPVLGQVQDAVLGIRTLQETVDVQGEIPFSAPAPASGGGTAGTTTTSVTGAAMSGVESVRLEMSPTPIVVVRSHIHLTIAGHTQGVRTVEIFAGGNGYVEMFTGAPGGTWYRIPKAQVPDMTRILDSEASLAAAQGRMFSLLHPRLVPGPSGTISVVEAAHLSSLTELLAAMPSAQSGLGAVSLGRPGLGGLSVGLSGLTLYNAQTLWPKASVMYATVSIDPGKHSAAAGVRGVGETLRSTFTINRRLALTVPQAALDAPYLAGAGGPPGRGSTKG